jgi:hypothetical protein
VNENDPKLLVDQIFSNTQIQLNSATDLSDSTAPILEINDEFFQRYRFFDHTEKASS